MDKFFITSSGTEIGKTFVTTVLCRQLIAGGKKVVALKPVISGYDSSDMKNDSALILQNCGVKIDEENIEKISPWRFSAPLSPNMAAKREGRKIQLGEVVAFCKEHEKLDIDVLLVEGVGGVCVPLNEKYTVLDWIVELNNWKIILVVGSYLGSISHALTAIQALAARNLTLQAVIVNESENSSVSLDETVETLRNFIEKSVAVLAIPRQHEDNLELLPALEEMFL